METHVLQPAMGTDGGWWGAALPTPIYTQMCPLLPRGKVPPPHQHQITKYTEGRGGLRSEANRKRRNRFQPVGPEVWELNRVQAVGLGTWKHCWAPAAAPLPGCVMH